MRAGLCGAHVADAGVAPSVGGAGLSTQALCRGRLHASAGGVVSASFEWASAGVIKAGVTCPLGATAAADRRHAEARVPERQEQVGLGRRSRAGRGGARSAVRGRGRLRTDVAGRADLALVTSAHILPLPAPGLARTLSSVTTGTESRHWTRGSRLRAGHPGPASSTRAAPKARWTLRKR